MQNLARCTRVIDGDTFEAVIDLGFYITVKITVRLYGVNCPEMHPKNDAAEAAKAYVISRIENKDIHIWSYKKDSFGRWLCDVLVDGLLLSKEIIDKGHGVPYFGDRLGDNHD